MIIDCISDLHGYYPDLKGGDLLIVAGDLTAQDTNAQLFAFYMWICDQKYNKKIVIAGNHDNLLQSNGRIVNHGDFEYLCDSGTEFEGLKIWGSPWTKTFKGMNPCCKAFTCDTEEQLAERWALIPEDTNILICHSPMYGLNDGPDCETRLGSTSLLRRHVTHHLNTLKLFVCGHIHEGYGKYDIREAQKQLGDPIGTVHVNASHVNEHYQPVNKPVRVIL